MALDDKRMETFLNTMDMLGNKHSIPPTALANLLFSVIEIMLRADIEPHKLDEVIKSKVNELKEINNKIETSIHSLEETKASFEEQQNRLKIKQKDLDQFHDMSGILELYNYPEFSTKYGDVVRALMDINNLGYDAKVIVSKYEKFESLTKANKKLKVRLQEKLRELEAYKHKSDEEQARWKDHDKAHEIFVRLLKDGLKEEDIFTAVSILNNDFTPDKTKQLLEDIRTYGSINAAKSKLKREHEEETESLF